MIRKCTVDMIALSVSLLIVANGLPALTRAQRHNLEVKTQTMEKFGQLWMAMSMYYADYKVYPPMQTPQTVAKALLNYGSLKSKTALMQPVSGHPYLPNPNLSGKKRQSKNPILFYESRLNPDDTRGVLFEDGGMKWLHQKAWLRLKKQAHIP